MTVERASPGLAALFEGLVDDGRHSLLDFGQAGNAHLSRYGPYASQIRFVGLVPRPPRGEAWKTAVQALPPNPEHPYDVLLTWDVLDRIAPSERPELIARLADISAPGARFYAVIDTSGASVRPPTRSTLIGTDRVSELVVGPPEPTYPPLLPAPVEKLLHPFVIMHAYTLRSGQREYLAIKS